MGRPCRSIHQTNEQIMIATGALLRLLSFCYINILTSVLHYFFSSLISRTLPQPPFDSFLSHLAGKIEIYFEIYVYIIAKS